MVCGGRCGANHPCRACARPGEEPREGGKAGSVLVERVSPSQALLHSSVDADSA